MLKEFPVKTIIGSSGTMENIAAMIADRNSLTASMTLNELQFSAKDFKKFNTSFLKLDRSQRLKEDKLEEKRVDIIAPGMVLLDYLIRAFDIEQVKISESALREGMVLHYIKNEKNNLDLELHQFFRSPPAQRI